MKTAIRLHALFIGINGYKEASPLSGCINDVLAVSDYFKHLCAAQDPPTDWQPDYIKYLLAPADAEEEASLREKGIDYQVPTRQNIIDAFQIYDAADPERGDFCLFYYSGHGSYTRAPDLFQDCEPAGRLQTIVCLDSRQAGQRDLLDKELGYLIAKSLEGKGPSRDGGQQYAGVHFLAITDSCHSGTNTRGSAQDLVARMMPTSNHPIDTDGILGFTREGNCFYEKFQPGQERIRRYNGLKHARYIKLSSAQDAEKAYETSFSIPQAGGKPPLQLRHGVFTYSMIATLHQSGANLSYGELIRRIQMELSGLVSGQVPRLDNTEAQDDELLFLRNVFSTPKQEYEVFFRAKAGGEWIMNAGAIHGIVPSAGGQRPQVKIFGAPKRLVEVVEVRATESVLDSDKFSEADKQNRQLSATIFQMAFPAISIDFGPALLKDDEPMRSLRKHLRQAWKQHKPKFLAWAAAGQKHDLEINLVKNNDGSQSYILTHRGSQVPLFERHDQANVFLGDVEKVARYQTIVDGSSPGSAYSRSNFQVEVKILEGIPFNAATLHQIPEGQYRSMQPNPTSVPLIFIKSGDKYIQPAIKVRISCLDNWNKYFIGALYCNSQFGINPDFLPVQPIGAGYTNFVDLKFVQGTQTWDALPIAMHDKWHALGIQEIEDYLIIYISSAKTPFNLSIYRQSDIRLDVMRDASFTEDVDITKGDWWTIKIPIRITRPF